MACGSAEVIQSRVSSAEAVCPRCGAPNEVSLWNVLEADLNPERAAALASGDLLVERCPSCKGPVPLDYPLFYVDRTRKVAAFYPAHRGEKSALETAFVQAVTRVGGVDLSDLRRREIEMRLVAEPHELVEKVAAWQAGLDDRILELLKVQLLEELAASNPDRRLCDATFTNTADEGAKLEFLLFAHPAGDDEAVVPANAGIALPYEAYRRLARSGAVLAAVDRRYAPTVDAAWARDVLARLRAGE
jgi:hypothetical protein